MFRVVLLSAGLVFMFPLSSGAEENLTENKIINNIARAKYLARYGHDDVIYQKLKKRHSCKSLSNTFGSRSIFRKRREKNLIIAIEVDGFRPCTRSSSNIATISLGKNAKVQNLDVFFLNHGDGPRARMQTNLLTAHVGNNKHIKNIRLGAVQKGRVYKTRNLNSGLLSLQNTRVQNAQIFGSYGQEIQGGGNARLVSLYAKRSRNLRNVEIDGHFKGGIGTFASLNVAEIELEGAFNELEANINISSQGVINQASDELSIGNFTADGAFDDLEVSINALFDGGIK